MKKIALLLMMTVAFSLLSSTFVWASDVDPYNIVPVNPPVIVTHGK